MAGDEIVKGAQSAVSGLGEIVKLAKESPDAAEAGKFAAKSLKIVAQTVHTILLPLAAANYGAARFEKYMKTKFAPELSEALSDVPDERIQAPSLTIAGPVLNALVYAHEEPEVRRLYVALLATAMDAEGAAEHPAFVEVLRQLDVRELPYLRALIPADLDEFATTWPIVRLVVNVPKGYNRVHEHLLDWRDPQGAVRAPHCAAYVDNWVRLGIFDADYRRQIASPDAYAWVEGRPEYADVVDLVSIAEEHEDGDEDGARSVGIQKGVLTLTEWGDMFARAVRISDVPPGTAFQMIGAWDGAPARSPQTPPEPSRA